MSGTKMVLRTAHVGDVFRLGKDVEITHEGYEFSSKTAAADAIEAAALNGIQLYVVPENPDEFEYPEDQADRPRNGLDEVDRALIASGLDESTPPPPKKPASGSGTSGGNS